VELPTSDVSIIILLVPTRKNSFEQVYVLCGSCKKYELAFTLTATCSSEKWNEFVEADLKRRMENGEWRWRKEVQEGLGVLTGNERFWWQGLLSRVKE